jgi:glycosyltransferase involved in cell wall biosynthesis
MRLATVAIPCLNAADTIGRVLAALEIQTIRDDLEVVVVDNGSNDGSVRIAKANADRVIIESQPGIYAARNRALSQCHAPFFLSLDADCRPVDERWAERHLGALNAAPQSILATAAPLIPELDSDWWSQRADITPQPGVEPDGSIRYPVGANNCARTSLLKALGGFPNHPVEDAALGRRAHAAGLDFVWVAEAVAYHRNPCGVRGYFQQVRKVGRYATQFDNPTPPASLALWASGRAVRGAFGISRRFLKGEVCEAVATMVKVPAQICGSLDVWKSSR